MGVWPRGEAHVEKEAEREKSPWQGHEARALRVWARPVQAGRERIRAEEQVGRSGLAPAAVLSASQPE